MIQKMKYTMNVKIGCQAYRIARGIITITNSTIETEKIGAGNGGKGGYVYRTNGGSGGNGGDCNNINITNSKIISKYKIGEAGKGLKGGVSFPISYNPGNDGQDGTLSGSITINNSIVIAENKGTIDGTINLDNDLEIDNLTIKENANLTISENKKITVQKKLSIGNSVTISGNGELILGLNATLEGSNTNLSYMIEVSFRKDNNDWNDVISANKNIKLIYNTSSEKSTIWNIVNNRYSTVIKFNDVQCCSLYIENLDTKKSINKNNRKITLDYNTLSFSLMGGVGSVENQCLLKDVEHPEKPNKTITRQYYSFDDWSSDYTGNSKVDFDNATISNQTTYYAIWKANEITLKNNSAKQELIYNKAMTEYNLSSLLSDDVAEKCGTITYSCLSLPDGLNIDKNTGIISGTPTVVISEKEINITATSQENRSTKEIPVTFTINKSTPSITEFANITSTIIYGETFTIEAPEAKGEGEESLTPGITYYSVYNNTEKIKTSTNDGANSEGEVPKFAGQYTVVASLEENDNYEAANEQTAEFIIEKAKLTVTPLSDQIVFQNEKESFKPKYEVTGAVNNDEPQFNGDLKLDNDGKIIVNKDLTLNDPFDKNYSMTIEEGVTVTILDNTAANDMIVLSGTADENAYIDQVTITAPDGFLIKLVSSTQTKAMDGYDKSFIWDQIGTFDVDYKLKRIDGGQESDSYTITVTVKKKNEEPDEPVNPPVEPEEPIEPTVYHTVTLPSVDGATTDPAAGDHKVEAWGSFRFRLTLDKDYDLSKPVVTTDYGAVIASQGEDGVYVINFVNRSFEIRIDGVVKNPDPVANAEIQSGIKVWANNRRLFIRTDRPEEVSVYTFSGQLQKKFRSEVGDRFISLPSGTYIVLIGDKRFKVIL